MVIETGGVNLCLVKEKYTMKESYNADDLYLARFKWVSSEVTNKEKNIKKFLQALKQI